MIMIINQFFKLKCIYLSTNDEVNIQQTVNFALVQFGHVNLILYHLVVQSAPYVVITVNIDLYSEHLISKLFAVLGQHNVSTIINILYIYTKYTSVTNVVTRMVLHNSIRKQP